MRVIIVRTYAFLSSFLLFVALALFILSGVLNHSYTSTVTSSTNLSTVTRIEAEEVIFGAFKECVKYSKSDSSGSSVLTNVVNSDYCSVIDLNCNIIDPSGSQRDAFCPDGMFCSNDSENTTKVCNMFNTYRAFLILGAVCTLLAWLLMMLSICTLGRCSSGLAMSLAILGGIAGAISMVCFDLEDICVIVRL